MRHGFTIAEAVQVCELTAKQVRTLAAGPVPPSLRAPAGRGSVVFFDAFDLLKLLCVAQMAALLGGVRAGWASEAAGALEPLKARGVAGQALLFDGEGVQALPSSAVSAAMSRAPVAVVVQLDELASTLDFRVARRLGQPPVRAA